MAGSSLYISLPYIEGENVSGVEEELGSNVQLVSLVVAGRLYPDLGDNDYRHFVSGEEAILPSKENISDFYKAEKAICLVARMTF